MQLLDILLYRALVIRCQCLWTKTLQDFRDQVAHFLMAFQPGFDASTPGFDIMLPVDPEQALCRWETGSACERRYRVGEHWYNLRPDALAEYSVGKSRIRFWLAPHRVTLENHGHFYGRTSAGHFQMDVPQLRTAFELSGTLTERIRDFRADRLSKIIAGEIPTPLQETMAKIVFHLVPFGAFEPSARFDLSSLAHPEKRKLITPLMLGMNEHVALNHCRYRYNFDGLLNCAQWANDLPVVGYLQIFRNGIVEGVDVSILNMDRFPRQIPSMPFEQVLCYALSLYLQTQKALGVDLPIFLLRDRFDPNPAEVMKPIFDAVWNAAGRNGSMYYDAAGKWTLQKLE
jgi:hypothetical protein